MGLSFLRCGEIKQQRLMCYEEDQNHSTDYLS